MKKNLLKSEVRKWAQNISDILANDFIEFCSNGSEYYYKNGDIFQEQENNTELLGKIIDFRIKELSQHCMLAMYKLIKFDKANENNKYSLRSSI